MPKMKKPSAAYVWRVTWDNARGSSGLFPDMFYIEQAALDFAADWENARNAEALAAGEEATYFAEVFKASTSAPRTPLGPSRIRCKSCKLLVGEAFVSWHDGVYHPACYDAEIKPRGAAAVYTFNARPAETERPTEIHFRHTPPPGGPTLAKLAALASAVTRSRIGGSLNRGFVLVSNAAVDELERAIVALLAAAREGGRS